MASVWTKTKFVGVRYREHATRKHGVRLDRYFALNYKVTGKVKNEAVGWASEGWTAEKAFELLAEIRKNLKSGSGPRTLAEMRIERQEKAEAKKVEQQAKAKAAITFAEFWEQEYLPIATATKRPGTLESEQWLYSKWIAPALGDIPLQKIDTAKVEAVALHAKKAGKSAATIRYIIAIVSQVWNKAAARDLVPIESPTQRVKKPRQDNRRTRFLSREEARTILAALKKRSPDIYDEALLSLFCGLRAGEIHDLTWGDVDMENETIHIRDPKNKLSRHAFMTDEIKAMLKGRMKGQAKSDLVFPAVNGKRRRWVSDSFVRTIDALGLNDTGEFTINEAGEQVPVKMADARQRVVFHTLRHTFASWLVQDGTPLYTVAELMGHTTLEMTRRYSHLAPDSLRMAAMRLQGKLEQKPGKISNFLSMAQEA